MLQLSVRSYQNGLGNGEQRHEIGGSSPLVAIFLAKKIVCTGAGNRRGKAWKEDRLNMFECL